MTQEAVAEVLGVPLNAISKIEAGRRGLSESEKKLLDLYFFGKMPEGLVRTPEELNSSLNFTDQEWKMVQILAYRAGQDPASWIRSQILSYLSFAERMTDTGFLKAAEDAPPFGEKKAAKGPHVTGNANADTTFQPGNPPPPLPQRDAI